MLYAGTEQEDGVLKTPTKRGAPAATSSLFFKAEEFKQAVKKARPEFDPSLLKFQMTEKSLTRGKMNRDKGHAVVGSCF